MNELTGTELFLIKTLILEEKNRLQTEIDSLVARKMNNREQMKYMQKKDLNDRFETILQKIRY